MRPSEVLERAARVVLLEAARDYDAAVRGGDSHPLLAGARLRIAAKAWAAAERSAADVAGVTAR